MAKTNINENQMLDNLAEDLADIIVAESRARTAAIDAKETYVSTGGDGIRAISKRFSQLNITLNDDKLTELVDDTAKKAKAKGEPMLPVRKSELKTMLGQGRNLPAIIAALDKIKADPKTKNKFNLREKTIAAARKMRDDRDLTLTEAIKQVFKAPLSDDERARALTERLRKEKSFLKSVGDTSMVDPLLEPAIKTLEDYLDGELPVAIEDSEPYKALKLENEGLKAALKAARDAKDDTELYDVTTTALEAVDVLQGPQDGRESETSSDSPESEEATAASPDELAAAKDKATSPGLTGFVDVLGLMDNLIGKKD